MNEPKLIETQIDFHENAEGLVIEKAQHIPQWWLDQLKAQRAESKNAPTGDYVKAASIPQAVHEEWLKQGYDCTKEPIRKTIARLKAEGLDYFITSDKQF